MFVISLVNQSKWVESKISLTFKEKHSLNSLHHSIRRCTFTNPDWYSSQVLVIKIVYYFICLVESEDFRCVWSTDVWGSKIHIETSDKRNTMTPGNYTMSSTSNNITEQKRLYDPDLVNSCCYIDRIDLGTSYDRSNNSWYLSLALLYVNAI